jgi:hypothetical protein
MTATENWKLQANCNVLLLAILQPESTPNLYVLRPLQAGPITYREGTGKRGNLCSGMLGYFTHVIMGCTYSVHKKK